jgi:hypothetical protein
VYTYAMKELFNRVAGSLTQHLGSPIALAVAASVILVWAEGLSDPGRSDDSGRPSGDRAEVESDRPASG